MATLTLLQLVDRFNARSRGEEVEPLDDELDDLAPLPEGMDDGPAPAGHDDDNDAIDRAIGPVAHHEQSETVRRGDRWVNVYGKKTPKAGQRLPKDASGVGHEEYGTVNDAVRAATERSSKHRPHGLVNKQMKEE